MEINNENNFIKYEGKTDFSDLASTAYNDGGKKFIKELGQARSYCS